MDALRQQFPADDFTLLAIVLALPLLGALINGLFGKRLGKEAVRMMALTAVGGSFVLSLLTFFTVATAQVAEGASPKVAWHAWHWFSVAARSGREVPIDIAFSADALTATMMLIVTGVGFLIHLYSTGYMEKDPGYHRVFADLNLFIFSMMVLILGDNLAVLFIGWEGVGLCSYLLIGFWFDDEKKAAAGKKAFITNRIGDFGLLVAMAMLVYHSGTLTWSGIAQSADALVVKTTIWPLTNLCEVLPESIAGFLSPSADPAALSQLGVAEDTAYCDLPAQVRPRTEAFVVTLIALALFLGCVGKSAQVPLFVWLPDAMAGPTPVSALIHAATMVTAGVYLIARCSFLFVLSPIAMAVIAGIGAFTALLAATIALTQTDLKKVLAYSTVSQLGFMFIGVGSGAFAAGFFHVITHAFFKGCLFLCAGSVIHAMHVRLHDDDASQDMRNMGGLRKYMPVTHWTYLISCLAIAGCPPLAGFWSKDEILWMAFSTEVRPTAAGMLMPPAWFGQAVYAVALIAAVCTAFYMFRSYFMTFHGEFRGWKIVQGFRAKRHGHGKRVKGPVPHESPWTMTLPLGVLAGLAAVSGFLYAHPIHIEPLFNFWEPVFAQAVSDRTIVDPRPGTEGMLYPMLVVGIGAFVAGAGAAYYVYQVKHGEPARQLVSRVPRLHRLVYDKWRVDELYDVTAIGMIDAMGDTAAQLDKWVIDGIIARVTAAITRLAGNLLRTLQSGRVQVYAASMVIGTALLGWFLLTPHADAKEDTTKLIGKGDLTLTAAPGHGYKYRWHLDGEEPGETFDDKATLTVNLKRCEAKKVHLSVKNLFGRVASKELVKCRESKPGCCEEGASTKDPGGKDSAKSKPTASATGLVELPPPGKYDAGVIKQLLNPRVPTRPAERAPRQRPKAPARGGQP